MELTKTEQQNEKRSLQREDTLWDIWDSIKCNGIHIIGPPEGEEREKGPEKLNEEKVDEHFPNLGKTTDLQIQEAQSSK